MYTLDASHVVEALTSHNTPRTADKESDKEERSSLTHSYVLRWQPGEPFRLRHMVDATHNGGMPIDRSTDCPMFRLNGMAVSDARRMRQGVVKTTAQHLADLEDGYPDEAPLAYVGNGNLLANYAFVAWEAGVLYHLSDEPVFSHAYVSLVSWHDGRVTVEDLWFAQERGQVIVLRACGHTVEDITAQVAFVTSGQPLVRHGEAQPLTHMTDKWYDLRHLVRPLRMSLNGTTLFVPTAQLQQGLVRKALGEAVQVRLEAHVADDLVVPLSLAGWRYLAQEQPTACANAMAWLHTHGVGPREMPSDGAGVVQIATTLEHLVEASLQEAGYRLVDHTQQLREGEARMVNGHMEMFFRQAPYPHNMFVQWADGTCGFVLFPGQSGRSGTTLTRAQEVLLKEMHAVEALGLDNGGDVRLWYRGQYLVPSSEAREELRALLVLTAPKGAWCGNRVVVY